MRLIYPEYIRGKLDSSQGSENEFGTFYSLNSIGLSYI
jgi:hypothetical protein